MTPTEQTNYEKGKGNCLTACVASVLDVPISSLPEFCIDGEWFIRLSEFCTNNGFILAYWRHSSDVPLICMGAYLILLLTLEGTEEMHAVIAKAAVKSVENMESGETRWEWHTELVHDPNTRYVPNPTGVHSYILIAKQ